MLDIVALSGAEWVFDRVERRYGRAAAWVVTLALAAVVIGATLTLMLAVI